MTSLFNVIELPSVFVNIVIKLIERNRNTLNFLWTVKWCKKSLFFTEHDIPIYWILDLGCVKFLRGPWQNYLWTSDVSETTVTYYLLSNTQWPSPPPSEDLHCAKVLPQEKQGLTDPAEKISNICWSAPPWWKNVSTKQNLANVKMPKKNLRSLPSKNLNFEDQKKFYSQTSKASTNQKSARRLRCQNPYLTSHTWIYDIASCRGWRRQWWMWNHMRAMSPSCLSFNATWCHVWHSCLDLGDVFKILPVYQNLSYIMALWLLWFYQPGSLLLSATQGQRVCKVFIQNVYVTKQTLFVLLWTCCGSV